MNLTVVTWNLHGSARPDLDQIAERLSGSGVDVVALQEVRCRQARTLARALGWPTAHWSFKHWPIPNSAEGLAVLSPHTLIDARTVTLSRWVPPWSYRRRIGQLCALDVGGRTLHLANCHLANDDANARLAQAERLIAQRTADSFVFGDLNARARGDAVRLLLRAGLRDAWAELHPNAGETDGATNWRPRDPDDRPANRIDYILVPARYRVVTASVPSAADNDLPAYRRLSDHLPVRVELEDPLEP